MNDCITTTKQSTTKPCAYFLGYTVSTEQIESNPNYNKGVSEQGIDSHRFSDDFVPTHIMFAHFIHGLINVVW